MSDNESQHSDQEDITIASDNVVNKYKIAAEISNSALKSVIEACQPNANTYEICCLGDKIINEKTASLFKKQKDLKKGLAWPTSVSVNNLICHYSPLKSYESPIILKEGDMVKIELGAHIDGFPSMVAHTLVVGQNGQKITGRKADVILAAHTAAQAALRMLKAGTVNRDITKVIQKTCSSFKCNPIQNMSSICVEKDIVVGEKSILLNCAMVTDEQNKQHEVNSNTKNEALLGEKCEIEVNDVWALDILVSSEDGKISANPEIKTSLYRRDPHTEYMLKMKASREVLSTVMENHQYQTFSLRNLQENEKCSLSETKIRLGLKECMNHEVIVDQPVMQEAKPEALVAQFKYTVLILSSGMLKITGIDLDESLYVSEYKIEDEDILKLLATSISKKSKKRNKKKSKQAASDGIKAALA